MTMVEELAGFVVRASYEDLSAAARHQLKVRVLDSLACALGALEGEPIAYIRAQLDDFGGSPHCTLIGGGRTAPDRAAFYNGALVRYLDFNDTYLAPGETCHPSDNLGAVLAAAEYAGRSGRDLMVALAVAYQVQGRLSEVAPVRAKGFDHTTQGSYAAAAGVARALGLDEVRTAHAIAIAGTAFNALRVTRTGALSHWKGLAYPNTAFGATHAAFLAMRGITGPLGVFEGNKGFMDAIAGRFYIDWSREDLELVTRTILKKYNAEVHSQSTIEAVEELMAAHPFKPEDVEEVEVETFDVAYHIIGGGEEGDKTVVRTKEEADHSLPYIVAVMILDGQVMPEQYRPERILRADVQSLLRKVKVRPRDDLSRRFPAEMPCRVVIRLRDGRVLEKEKADYEGFHTRPMTWAALVNKFERLAAPYTDPDLRREIIAAVANLDGIRVSDLTALLARAGRKT
jgi:2-methylcitrate dehydratase